VEAFGDEAGVSRAVPAAAAIELLHNATLTHDDVLDLHDYRGSVLTLRGAFGSGEALLAGDAMVGLAMRHVAELPIDDIALVLDQLGRAFADVAAGQAMDEPSRWARIDPARRWDQWLAVCRGKLAIGNVGGPLAAVWTGRAEWAAPLREELIAFSVVSQIINDIGDLHGFSGYQTAGTSRRSPCEETSRKPTLASIWAGPELLDRAIREIEQRRERALGFLGTLPMSAGARARLESFFSSPKLPEGLC
jgi:geranylgeranyl diphosphate synthase type I